MRHEDLPNRWKIKVMDYLKSKGETSEHLGASDFPSDMVAKVYFADDSYAEFRYPMIIEAPEFNEIALFTEHCGYHIFAQLGTKIELEKVKT